MARNPEVGRQPARDNALQPVKDAARAMHTALKRRDAARRKMRHARVALLQARGTPSYGGAQTAYDQARADYLAISEEFRKKLEELKRAKSELKTRNRRRAAAAGVPPQYRDRVKVSKRPDGSYDIYFGGVGAPDGPGHGHFVLSGGEVTYRREPNATGD